MTLTYTDGRLQLTLGPNSKFTRLFRRYEQRLDTPFFHLMPEEELQDIYSRFQIDLDPTGLLKVDDEELERLVELLAVSTPLENNALDPSDKVAEEVSSTLDQMNENYDFKYNSVFDDRSSRLDYYRELMSGDIATYMGERLRQSSEALSEKLPFCEERRRADDKIYTIYEGLKDAILIFKWADDEVYMHDRQTELAHNLLKLELSAAYH